MLPIPIYPQLFSHTGTYTLRKLTPSLTICQYLLQFQPWFSYTIYHILWLSSPCVLLLHIILWPEDCNINIFYLCMLFISFHIIWLINLYVFSCLHNLYISYFILPFQPYYNKCMQFNKCCLLISHWHGGQINKIFHITIHKFRFSLY